MVKFFNLFKKNKREENIKHEIKKPKNVLLKLKQFDDIWVYKNKQLFEGWIVEKIEDVFYAVYSDENKKLQDIRFKFERPLDRTEIELDDKIIFLNKPQNGENK